jgi:chromosome partitioning protein
MPIVYALANQKGGVGKTTTAVNVGAYLADMNQRVLLIDVDPQANATSSLGIDKRGLPLSCYDILVHDAPAHRVVRPTSRARLDLLPACPALAGATVEMIDLPQREYRLREALADIRDQYDYILIDCPPSLGILTVNALTATSGVIIPVQCEYLALEGLSQLSRAIQLVQRALNRDLRIRGLVMTMYDARTSLAQQVVEEVRHHFGEHVLETIIPRNVRLSEAPSYAQPIIEYAPRSTGAQAYETLTKEILAGDDTIKAPEAVIEATQNG